MLQTLSIIVTGKVQGVFYRQSARQVALELGVTGTVKNNGDGSVNIIVTGTKPQLDLFLSWCRQGPPRAMVNNVITEFVELIEFSRFEITR